MTRFKTSGLRKPLMLAMSLIMGVVMLSLQSCSNKVDATQLLKTVPTSASFVAVANVETMLDKCDCKVKGDGVEAGKEIQALLPKIENRQLKQLAQSFFSGKCGVETEAMVVFQEGYYTFLTGFISDTDDFKSTIETDFNTKFEEIEGVDVADNVAIINDQFWINLGQHSIDPKQAKRYSDLDKTNSFLANEISARLTEVDKDIEGWGSIPGLLSSANLDFQDRATVQVMLESVFENANSIIFSADFREGEFELEADVLNQKGKIAKTKFKTTPIDLNALGSLSCKADGLAAINLPKEMIAKLKKDTDKGAPSMLRIYLGALGSLDGTSAIAFNKEMTASMGIISINGENASDLQNMISDGMHAKVTREGNLLRFQTGMLSGKVGVAEMSPMLKDAFAGVVAIGDPAAPGWMAKAAKMTAITLMPKDSGLSLHIKVMGYNEKQNFLLTILSSIK